MKGYCNTSPPSGNRLLLLATTNANKFFEIRTALGQIGIPLYSLNDFPQVEEAPEEGDTFEEIGIKKAQYYWNHFKKPVIAEDSGLVVPSLGDFPGVRSARIAPDDASRMRLVLEKLQQIQEQSPDSSKDLRRAYYVCNMTFIANSETYTAEGKCEGRILAEPDGDQGFGYDPIFLPDGARQGFGRMSIKQKSQYSHRAKAVQMLMPHILAEFRRIPA